MKRKTPNRPRAKTVSSGRNRYKAKRAARYRRPSLVVGFLAAVWGAVKVVFSGVFILIFLGGLSVALIAGYNYLTNSRYFTVKKVVLTGLDRTTREEVLRSTGLDKSTNILAIRLGELGVKLRALPWVKDVTLTRRLPDTIMVQIVERRARTLILLDSLYYLDETGLPFKKVDPKDKPELPIITGFARDDFVGDRRKFSRQDLDQVFGLLEVLIERNDRFRLANISEIHFDKVRGLSLFTRDDNVQVKIGFGDYRSKMKRLGRVLAHLKIKGRSDGLTYFNLECSPRVVVRRAVNS